MKKSLLVMAFCAMAATGAAQAETTDTTATAAATPTATATVAAENTPSKVYIGLALGVTKTDFLKDQLEGLIPVDDQASKDAGVKIFLGLKTNNPHFDTQFSLVSLGEFNNHYYESNGLGDSILFDGSVTMTGIYASGLLKLPFASKRGALYGKLGAGFSSVKQEATGERTSGGITVARADMSETDTGISFTLGLGLNFDLTKHFGIQVEAERYFVGAKKDGSSDDTSTVKVDLASVGLYYRF